MIKVNINKVKISFRNFLSFNNFYFIYFLILYINVIIKNLSYIARFN